VLRSGEAAAGDSDGAGDDRHHVVEVVRDAAGKLADGVHLGVVPDLRFGRLALAGFPDEFPVCFLQLNDAAAHVAYGEIAQADDEEECDDEHNAHKHQCVCRAGGAFGEQTPLFLVHGLEDLMDPLHLGAADASPEHIERGFAFPFTLQGEHL
jgi:hypothetical protein